MAFVATSAPAGWKLGRWSAVSSTTWQEEKLDNNSVAHQFQVVSGPSMPGSRTVRLKMKDQNTEVLLLDTSAQVFVNGSYFGEYGGEWQGGGARAPSRTAAPAAATAQARGPASKPPAATPERVSSKGAAFEQPQAQQKSAAPSKEAPARAAPAAPAFTPVNTLDRSEFQTSIPDMPSRPTKKPGLDNSHQSVQKLIDASKNGDMAKVKECLDSGIDPDGPGKDGRTPLMAAAGGGHIKVVEALLDSCADPTLGKGEETPLTIAFQKGKQDILKVLFGASFNYMNNVVGPKFLDLPDSDVRVASDVPDNAEGDLREITTMIAHMNAGRESPSNTGKYGNYASVGADIQAADDESEMLRTEAVKLAMKSLTKTNRDYTGVPRSPGLTQ